MASRLARLLLAGLPLVALVPPAEAKVVTVPIRWSVNKGDLSIARVRTSVGPKIRNYVCTTYRKGQHPGNVLKSGGSVRVVIYGYGDVLTTFTYTRQNCR